MEYHNHIFMCKISRKRITGGSPIVLRQNIIIFFILNFSFETRNIESRVQYRMDEVWLW